jgi:hypothetical protein
MSNTEECTAETTLQDAATVHAVRMELRPLVEQVALALAGDPLHDQVLASVDTLRSALGSDRAAQGRAAHGRISQVPNNAVGRSL